MGERVGGWVGGGRGPAEPVGMGGSGGGGSYDSNFLNHELNKQTESGWMKASITSSALFFDNSWRIVLKAVSLSLEDV